MKRNEFLDWLQHQLQDNAIPVRRYPFEPGIDDLEIEFVGRPVRLRIVATPSANVPTDAAAPVHRASGTPIEHRRIPVEAEHAFYASSVGQEPVGPPVRRQRRTGA